jgi:hypothetical protein
MGLFGRLWGKEGGGAGADGADQPESAPAAEAPPAADAYADLDPRVATLLTDFEHRRFGLGPTGAVDYPACRDAVLDLHEQVADEPSRVALVRFHGALMGAGVEGLRREGRDSFDLEALWRQDYYGMLLKEVVGPDGEVDQAALDRVNAREKEAGRLGEGETLQVQRAPAAEPQDEPVDETGLRSARAIGERALALWTVVLRAIAPHQRETLLHAFAAEGERHWLTEPELSFLLDAEPEQRDIVGFGWQAERLAVLLWAVGLAELPAHDTKCDPTAFAPLLPPTSQQAFADFLAGLRRRDPREIGAVAADINQSYWDAHDAGAQGLPIPPGVDMEILDERLRAAVWLLGREVPEWP